MRWVKLYIWYSPMCVFTYPCGVSMHEGEASSPPVDSRPPLRTLEIKRYSHPICFPLLLC